MPRYSYRCRTCGNTFEMTRPMAESATAAQCPDGHDDTVKLLTTFGVTTRGDSPAPASAPSGGGCCGGGCCR